MAFGYQNSQKAPTISQQERSALVERLLKMTFEYMADTANQSC